MTQRLLHEVGGNDIEIIRYDETGKIYLCVRNRMDIETGGRNEKNGRDRSAG
jgi:hypothetical protein